MSIDIIVSVKSLLTVMMMSIDNKMPNGSILRQFCIARGSVVPIGVNMAGLMRCDEMNLPLVTIFAFDSTNPKVRDQRYLKGQTPYGTNPHIRPTGWYSSNEEEPNRDENDPNDDDNEEELGTAGPTETEEDN